MSTVPGKSPEGSLRRMRPEQVSVPAKITPVYSEIPPPASTPQETSLLVEGWQILWANKWLLLVCVLAGGIAGFVRTLPQPAAYRARVMLEMQGLNDQFLDLNKVDPNSRAGSYGSDANIQTQIRILQSATVRDRTIEVLKKRGPAATEGAPAERTGWRKWLPVRPRPASFEDLLNEAAQNVQVRAIGVTRIVEASTESRDAQLAADFVNTLAEEYTQYDLEVRWNSAQTVSAWFGKQLESLRGQLQQSEQNLQAYANRSAMLFSSDKESVGQEKLRQVQQELSAAQHDRMMKQAMSEASRASAPDAMPLSSDTGVMREYHVKLTDLRRQLAEATVSLTPEHPKVKRLQVQIEEQENGLRNERKALSQRIQSELDAAMRREKLLADAYEKQARVVTDQSVWQIQHNMLKREVESTRQIYETMLQRVREASMASAIGVSTVRVVDTARRPLYPSSPNVRLASAVGSMFGLVFGLGIVLVRQRMDRSLRRPGQAWLPSYVRELGAIPSLKSDFRDSLADLTRSMLGSRERPVPGTLFGSSINDVASVPPGLVVSRRKATVLAESFRAVAYSILYSGDHQVLVCSSPSAGDGKTTVVSNLAMALVRAQRRVVVVDGDLRRPSVHKLFGMENQQGMRTVLEDSRPIDEYPLNELVSATSFPNLAVVTSGQIQANSMNLLYSERLSKLIRRLRNEFDIVLIDSPPLLQAADARLLSRLADGVVLVFRAGRTTPEMAQFVYNSLIEDGTRVVGTVLNDWKPDQNGRYGGYYASY